MLLATSAAMCMRGHPNYMTIFGPSWPQLREGAQHLTVRGLQSLQDVEEDLNDVQVDGHGREDVLIRGKLLGLAAHQHLEVIQEVEREDDRSNHADDQVHNTRMLHIAQRA